MSGHVLVHVFNVEFELITKHVLRSLSFAQEKRLRRMRFYRRSARRDHVKVRPRLKGVEVLLNGLQLAVVDGVSGENIEAFLKVEQEWVLEVVVFVVVKVRL